MGIGKCAYCFGKGKVNKQTISNIPVDLSYLTLERSKIERWKLILGSKNAKKRAELYQENLKNLINHIAKQYFVGELDIETIADLHYSRFEIRNISIEDKKEFMKYIEKVIELNRNKYL